jgi:hypothetical protein
VLVACSTQGVLPGTVTHGELVGGQPATVDLDGDGVAEEVLFDPQDRSLSITDGEVSYHTRAKWLVVQAALGDTDHDGLTEVVALLDSAKGRHLGLFAYFGGEYRERLVTQAIVPRPLAIEVMSLAQGDIVALVQAVAGDATITQRTFLRWNGFGFTRIEATAGP